MQFTTVGGAYRGVSVRCCSWGETYLLSLMLAEIKEGRQSEPCYRIWDTKEEVWLTAVGCVFRGVGGKRRDCGGGAFTYVLWCLLAFRKADRVVGSNYLNVNDLSLSTDRLESVECGTDAIYSFLSKIYANILRFD